MPVPTSNQGAESKRWLVPLLATSGHLVLAGCRRPVAITCPDDRDAPGDQLEPESSRDGGLGVTARPAMQQPRSGHVRPISLPVSDSLGHETRDGLATARLIERSSGAHTAGARSVAIAVARRAPARAGKQSSGPRQPDA